MSVRLPFTSALLVLLLAACAQQPRLPTSASWKEHSARLKELTSWTAEGKIALRTPEQSESASLQWHQQDNVSRLHLSGPLGVAATSMYSDGRTLIIRQGESVTTWDMAETSILEQRMGWDLPLQALPHWIKGLPAPDQKIEDMALGPDPSLLQMLKQDGWEIHFEAYANYGNFTLPTRLHLQREDSTVRLIIRNWRESAD
mgnify:CR=1 FL=1